MKRFLGFIICSNLHAHMSNFCWMNTELHCTVLTNERLPTRLNDQWEASHRRALESPEHTGLVCDVTPGGGNLLLPQLKPNKTPGSRGWGLTVASALWETRRTLPACFQEAFPFIPDSFRGIKSEIFVYKCQYIHLNLDLKTQNLQNCSINECLLGCSKFPMVQCLTRA